MVDEIDKKIIRELQQNGRPVLSLLAKKLGISLSTLSRRIKRLIAENTIRMIAVGPDPRKTGHGTVAVLGLSTEMNRIDEVCSEVCKLEEITWAGLCYGRFDLLFIVYVNSQEVLLSFIKNKVAAIKGVRDIETFYIAELKKRTPLAPP